MKLILGVNLCSKEKCYVLNCIQTVSYFSYTGFGIRVDTDSLKCDSDKCRQQNISRVQHFGSGESDISK